MYICIYIYIHKYSDIFRYIQIRIEHGTRKCRAAVKTGATSLCLKRGAIPQSQFQGCSRLLEAPPQCLHALSRPHGAAQCCRTVCVHVCVCVRVFVLCVCVCVCECEPVEPADEASAAENATLTQEATAAEAIAAPEATMQEPALAVFVLPAYAHILTINTHVTYCRL